LFSLSCRRAEARSEYPIDQKRSLIRGRKSVGGAEKSSVLGSLRDSHSAPRQKVVRLNESIQGNWGVEGFKDTRE